MTVSSTWLEVASSVELRTVVDMEDTATSRFFRQDGEREEAIPQGPSWPTVKIITPNPTSPRELQHLFTKCKVPAGYTLVDRVCAACEPPPPGCICVYADAIEAGMRFPLHDFHVGVLRHYGIAPSQLTPSAWRYMAAFVLLCNQVGVAPRVSAFRFLFSICHQKGWYHFKHYAVAAGEPPPPLYWRQAACTH